MSPVAHVQGPDYISAELLPTMPANRADLPQDARTRRGRDIPLCPRRRTSLPPHQLCAHLFRFLFWPIFHPFSHIPHLLTPFVPSNYPLGFTDAISSRTEGSDPRAPRSGLRGGHLALPSTLLPSLFDLHPFLQLPMLPRFGLPAYSLTRPAGHGLPHPNCAPPPQRQPLFFLWKPPRRAIGAFLPRSRRG